MATSKIFLPDVNVLLALASRRHIHWQICSDWLEFIATGSVILCRVSQMGLLRLLTNQAVMGADVLTSSRAWAVYRTMLSDERFSFAPEPFTLEAQWRKLTEHDRSSTKLWTDAYLSAFAHASGMRFVTLDQAVVAIAPEAILLK